MLPSLRSFNSTNAFILLICLMLLLVLSFRRCKGNYIYNYSQIFCVKVLLNVITLVILYGITSYLCTIKYKQSFMARRKDKVFQIRASETFMNLMKELADKKGMSQANLIEYLVRKEADSMQLKERFEQEQPKEGEE
nr:MAG TPA: hypothetical protein [Caudoviricetes sp.]